MKCKCKWYLLNSYNIRKTIHILKAASYCELIIWRLRYLIMPSFTITSLYHQYQYYATMQIFFYSRYSSLMITCALLSYQQFLNWAFLYLGHWTFYVESYVNKLICSVSTQRCKGCDNVDDYILGVIFIIHD